MLVDIRTGATINRVPFANHFDLVRFRLSPQEFALVVAEINARIDAAGGEIATAGWLPGGDWSGTAFWPIYERAARRDPALAGKLFGLCVWYAVMQRGERWGSGRYEKDGRDIGSRTYFLLR